MNVADLFPYVVSKDYLQLPCRGEQPSLDKWGVVEPIGPDLYYLLIDAAGGMIRNVHKEALAELGLSVAEGKAKAIDNLREAAADGEKIRRQIMRPENGPGHMVWLGDWFTASCIFLPELHGSSSKLLNAEELLVSVPERQFMFVFPVGDAEFRANMRKYIRRVAEGGKKLITFDLVSLTRDGLAAYDEPGSL